MQTSSVCSTVALEVSPPRLKSGKKCWEKAAADHPKLESPLLGASLHCLIHQYEKDAVGDVKIEVSSVSGKRVKQMQGFGHLTPGKEPPCCDRVYF